MSWGGRIAQFVLDALFSSLVALPLALLLHLGRHSDSGGTAWAVLGGLLCGVLTLYWYWVLRPVKTGQTWSMRLLGIRIVRADGAPLTTKTTLLRALLLLADGLACGLVGLIVMLRSPQRQRLGDAVAGALVVRHRKPFGRSDTTP
ncbi:RDD family protein [Streptomyces sp. NPDC002845]